MMFPADPPAASATAPTDKPADMVVVSRDTHTDILVSSDTPLLLVKAGRTEDALLRQAVFLTTTLTVVQSSTPFAAEMLRWSYEPFLQHQMCFTSMTGQFSCTSGEVTKLPETYSGEAPNTPAPADGPQTNPAAQAARATVSESLRARAPALFAENQRLKIEPILKASAVSVRTAGGTGASRR